MEMKSFGIFTVQPRQRIPFNLSLYSVVTLRDCSVIRVEEDCDNSVSTLDLLSMIASHPPIMKVSNSSMHAHAVINKFN